MNGDHLKYARVYLKFYLEVIRPFALNLSTSWLWTDDTELIVSSPALTYSICAFTSAFKNGGEDGLHSLALPPPTASKSEEPLWPVPEWFILNARAISLVRQHIAKNGISDVPVQKPELHTMLFLMRLQVFLGDRDAALLHLNAINGATEHAKILPDLHVDMAMWKINLMTAFKHRSALKLQPYTRVSNPAAQPSLLDIEELQVQTQERRRLRAHILNRTVVWQGIEQSRAMSGKASLVEDFLIIDAGYESLPAGVQTVMVDCLITARHVLGNIRYINSDSKAEKIRKDISELRRLYAALVQHKEAAQFWRRAPRNMFYMAFAGAYAASAMPEFRTWFIHHLCAGVNLGKSKNPQAAIMSILDMFVNPESLNDDIMGVVWNAIKSEVASTR